MLIEYYVCFKFIGRDMDKNNYAKFDPNLFIVRRLGSSKMNLCKGFGLSVKLICRDHRSHSHSPTKSSRSARVASGASLSVFCTLSVWSARSVVVSPSPAVSCDSSWIATN